MNWFRLFAQWIFCLTLVMGCAAIESAIGDKPLNVPPEFKQKVLLIVPDDYHTFQATRSTYDIGDLQSFHSQHAFPILVEEAFKEVFGQVEFIKEGPQIETGRPEVPAIFEVRLLDMSHDIHMDADSYRSEIVLGVAMKSPRENIFWQQSFRGKGYVLVETQFSTGLGPQDAVVGAVRDGLAQMQAAMIASPQVRQHMKYYTAIDQARGEGETGL